MPGVPETDRAPGPLDGSRGRDPPADRSRPVRRAREPQPCRHGSAVATPGFLLLALFTGMGLGDVKLAPAIGALLGWNKWTYVWWGIAVGFFLGAVYATVLLAAGRDRRAQVAFGSFMIIGALATCVTTGLKRQWLCV
jgi:prepilin signal peptidase PulO-like enzyme (type II secretory pathway)